MEKVKILFKKIFIFLNISLKYLRRHDYRKLFLLLFLFTTFSERTINSGCEENHISIKEAGELVYAQSVKTKAEQKLITEVSNYINEISPESEITPEYLVQLCIEYDMDIVFVLAQGILESHLGIKGVAARTNSVWNVGTYDNGTILYRYDHPDDSIEPYLSLLKRRYLIRITPEGDTINHNINYLLRDRGYTNLHGYRFASESRYENMLRQLIINIDMNTNISLYQSLIFMDDYRLAEYFMPFELRSTNNNIEQYALKN